MASVFRRDSTWYIRWRSASGWTQRATEAKSWAEAKGLAAELELEEQARRRFELREAAGLDGVQERCSETSRPIEGRRLEKHVIRRPAGALPLGLVRETVIENLLSDMERAGGSPASVNKLRSILHSVFSRARRAG